MVEKSGKNVRQKAVLNQAILATTPGGWLSLLTCEAEEAGRRRVILVDPRKHKPSQTDPVSDLAAVVHIRRRAPINSTPPALPESRINGLSDMATT